MTDPPRYGVAESLADQRHRQYHGAPLVEFALRLVDRWLEHRRRRSWGKQPSARSVSETQSEAIRD